MLGNAPRKRELTSPLQATMLVPPDPETQIQIGRPLASADFAAASAFLAAHPDRWVRIYNQPGRKGGDISWLANLPGLARVWLDFLPEDAFDPAQLQHLPATLTGLYLPAAPKARYKLPDLQRFPKLESLSLSGTFASFEPLKQLPRLSELTLFKAKFDDLASLSGHRCLERLVLQGCRAKRLDGAEHLPALKTLKTHDNRIDDIDALAGCTTLERLELSWCKSASSTWRLAGLHQLRCLLFLSSQPKLAFAQAWNIDALEYLWMREMDRDAVFPGGELRLPHPALKRIYLGDSPQALACARTLGVRAESSPDRMPFGGAE